MSNKRCRGMSLMELVVVIVIVGVLSAIAIPNFNRSRERALGQEARATVKLIVAAEKIYNMEAGSYYYSSDRANINTNLKLSLAATNWTYSITNAGGSYTVYAQRIAGYGSYSNCLYSLAYGDADDEPNANSTSYCP
ncbi:MAG: prepilin-type N-terminal cleavage/methylation domain-containing protein [Candidatus Omnitrophota bacterium]